jgi:hypothetical protein
MTVLIELFAQPLSTKMVVTFFMDCVKEATAMERNNIERDSRFIKAKVKYKRPVSHAYPAF